MISSSSRLLINENPLQVLPSLAVALKNINEAVILQQVQYWVNRSENEYGGRKWVYNTIKQWKDQFPWLTEKAIRNRFDSLIEKGVIITSNFNKSKFDRTKWYTIDYDKLNSLINNQNNGESPNATHSEESSESKRKKVPNATGSKVQMDSEKSSTSHLEESSTSDVEESTEPIPDNTIDYSEINTENTDLRSSAIADEPVSQSQKSTLTQIIEKEFEQLWSLYPRKLGKSKALKKYITWRKKSKSNTYDVMKAYLDKYLKYIELNQISSQYIIAGYKWFADRFDDELDLSRPQNLGKRYVQKRVRKVTDWKEYVDKTARKKAEMDSEPTLSDEEVEQIFKEYGSADMSRPQDSGDQERHERRLTTEMRNKIFKEFGPSGNSNVDSETDSHNLTQNANADYELSDSMKQFYHDLGLD
ncbi:hypothetical protein [Lactobacillus johnsonii]|uniref:hypothetical protein n=1 Tax=Lactobacillus johnsonii TaxID=33959 RepID=UPI0011B7396F|nr:hypothetical protein [Lactobacillus johnsonii]TWU79317.1 hypothetical protein DLD91_01901 [Lactobacillus johnsonii]